VSIVPICFLPVFGRLWFICSCSALLAVFENVVSIGCSALCDRSDVLLVSTHAPNAAALRQNLLQMEMWHALFLFIFRILRVFLVLGVLWVFRELGVFGVLGVLGVLEALGVLGVRARKTRSTSIVALMALGRYMWSDFMAAVCSGRLCLIKNVQCAIPAIVHGSSIV